MSWNWWRDNYDNMDCSQQKKFHIKIETILPNQNRFDFQRTFNFFAMIGKYVDVFEFGGFKGHLAKRILPVFDMIKSWDNYEICPVCVEKSVCEDKRYKCIVMDDFVWNCDLKKKYDVFYASHSMEHIKFEEFKNLIDNVGAKYVYLDIPIDDDVVNKNWFGYGGTHILEVGWKQIDEFMSLYYYKQDGFYIRADEA